AVYAVVAAHHAPGLRVAHGGLKWRQVNFVQRALVDAVVDAQAAGLLVVGGKVLGAGAHALALRAADEPRRQLAGQKRVLAVIFKVAAAQRAALDVDGRPQHDADAGSLRLARDGRTQALGQSGVKAGGSRAA